MSEVRSRLFVVSCAVAFFIAAPYIGNAQDAQPNQSAAQSQETDLNWTGLAPFIPIPTLALNEEAKKLVRDLEDRQLQERRALEDKYQSEIRELLQRQADERETLIARVSQP